MRTTPGVAAESPAAAVLPAAQTTTAALERGAWNVQAGAFGERANAVDQRGQVVENYVADGPYQPEEREIVGLFVPFADLTTGTETYQAGRYLDLQPTATGIYTIDFNRAYHPYCFYNAQYDCPYPPRENRLAVPIRSGERTRAVAATH